MDDLEDHSHLSQKSLDLLKQTEHIPTTVQRPTKRFYESKELKDLNLELNKIDPVKIFVCTFCGQWNKIHESQFKTMEELAKQKKKKRVIHMEVNEDVFIGWNKLKANFGTHERALAMALAEFYKHNR